AKNQPRQRVAAEPVGAKRELPRPARPDRWRAHGVVEWFERRMGREEIGEDCAKDDEREDGKAEDGATVLAEDGPEGGEFGDALARRGEGEGFGDGRHGQ